MDIKALLASCHTAQHWLTQHADAAFKTNALRDDHFKVLGFHKGLRLWHIQSDMARAGKLRSMWQAHQGDFHPTQQPQWHQMAGHIPSWWYAKLFRQGNEMLHTYRNAWIIQGLMDMGETTMIQESLQRWKNYQHPQTHAYPMNDTWAIQDRCYDLGTNAAVVATLLQAHQLEQACTVGQWMHHLIMRHAEDASTISLIENHEGQLLNMEQARFELSRQLHFFHLDAVGQTFWMLGYGFLGYGLHSFAALYRATQDDHWLVPTQRILQWLKRADSKKLDHFTSPQLGWGAMALYRATGLDDWHHLAQQTLERVALSLQPQGTWVYPEFKTAHRQPKVVDFDVVFERLFYLQSSICT